jgi:2-keto-4-pentenoate hydratase
MTMLANALRELVGLFVDDGALALAIVAVVALAGVVAMLGFTLAAGAILLFGCLGVLLANTVRAGRR